MADVLFVSTFEADADFAAALTSVFDGIGASLDSHYSLEAASGPRFDSIGSDDLAEVNTVTQAAGKIGNAAELVRANVEYLTAASGTVHDFGDVDVTIAGWFRINSKPTGMSMLAKWDTGTGNQSYLLQFESGADRVRLVVSSDGTSFTIVVANNFGVPPTGSFFFVVIWHDSVANTINIQIDNGTPNSAAFSGGIFSGTAPFRLGASVVELAQTFDGRVDEVSVFSRILTAAERTVLWHGGAGVNILDFVIKDFSFSFDAAADFTLNFDDTNFAFASEALAEFTADVSDVLSNIRQGLVSFLPLDENDTETRRDIKGSNDAVESGGTVEQEVQIASLTAPNSAHFDGAGEFLEKTSPVGLNLGAGSFTFGFWARIDGSLTTNMGGVSIFNPTGNQRKLTIFFFGAGADTWRFGVSSDGADDFSVNDDDIISATGEVHFVLAWYDGDANTINIQLDDGTVLSAAGPASVFGSTAPLQIGQLDTGVDNIFDGIISDLAIWSRVLTPAERTSLFNSGSGVNIATYLPKDLAAFTDGWLFNEGGGGTLVSINSLGDLPEIGFVPSTTGHVEDPVSSFLARGAYSPIGSPGPDNYHARPHVASDIFDLTAGKVSCTFAGWFKIPVAALAASPFGFTIHGERLNPGGAAGQALQIHLANATGLAKNPRVNMLDGITPFVGASVNATALAVAVPPDVFQFIAGGYDADRNKVFCFWGRSVGEFYYAEATGVAAGFGYTGTGTEIAFGEFQFPGTFNATEIWDQSLWFKGRALRLPELIFLWNNQVGRAVAALNENVTEFAFAFEADADFTASIVGASFAFDLTVDADFQARLSGTVLDGIDVSLESHYPLEEADGTTRIDFGPRPDNLADVNGVGQVTGKIGNAADFARVNSEFLEAADSTVHDFGDEDFTISFWGRLTTKTLPAQTFVSKFRPPSNRQYFIDFVFGGIDRFRFLIDSDSASTTIVEAGNFGSPTAGVLVHIVAWHDSVANTINISINNGTPNSAAHIGGAFQGDGIFSLGSYKNATFTPIEFLDGVEDEVTIWSRVLTATERQALFANGAGINLLDFIPTFVAADVEAAADFACELTTFQVDLDFIRVGMDSHYPLEEAGGTRVDFIGAEDLADINTVGQAAGKIGNAADFVAANSETLRGGTSTHSPGNADMTFACWVRVDTGAITGAIFSKTAGSPAGLGEYQLQYQPPGTDRIRFIVFDAAQASTIVIANSFGAIPLDTLIFVVAWHDSALDTINIQINNGTIDSAAFSAGLNQAAALFRVGSHGATEPADTTFLDGRVDELTVWNRVLTPAERTALFNNNNGVDLTSQFFSFDFAADAEFNVWGLTKVNVLDDICDLVRHYYRLEEVAGTALDVRGTGDLTQGTPPGNAVGKIGQARNFIRASAHDIFAASNTLLDFDGTADFTITCWASSDIGAGDKGIWGRFDGPGNDRGLFLFHDSAPTDNFRLIMSLDGSTNAVDIKPTFVLSTDVLYFLEVTYVSSTRVLQLRINRGTGSQVASAVVPAGTWFSTTIPWTLGDGVGTGDLHLEGLLDELLIHDRVLSTAELDALYNSDAGVNVNDLLLRLYKTDFEADADFTMALDVALSTDKDFVAGVQVDADFAADFSLVAVNLAFTFEADADFDMGATSFVVARALSFNFESAPTVITLSVERTLAFNFVAEANFQADPLTVFDAFQVGFQADADFDMGLAVTVINQLAFAFQADADFVALLEIADRLFRFDFDAVADFTTVLTVARDMAVSVEVDADFTVDFELAVQLLMTDFVAEANFQAVFGFATLALKFDFTADVDVTVNLFTADVEALRNDLLGLTDQILGAPFIKISGLSGNLEPSILDSQYQTEELASDETFLYLTVDQTVMAESTNAPPAPAAAAIVGAFFDSHASVAQDWFGKLFVLPPSVALGFVITDQSVPFEIYSSFLTATRSLDSIVNNVDSGFSLGGGFPLLPESILPQSGFTFTVDVDSDGPPLISGTIDFVFDIQTILVPFTGQRTILFGIPPDLPIVERLRFLTDVLVKKDEGEQRISKRLTPRQFLNYNFRTEGLERQQLEALILDAQDRSFGVPIWFEAMRITQPITSGDILINVDETAFSDLRVNGLAVVFESSTNFEVLEVAFITTNTVTFKTQLTNDHPSPGTTLYPARIAFMDSQIRGRKAPVNLQDTRIQFRVFDNIPSIASTAAFPTLDGKVFLDEANLIPGALTESWTRRFNIIDNRIGVFELTSDVELSRRGHQKRFLSTSRQRLWEVRQLMHALRGRQISFFIPTFYDEFAVTQAVGSADIILDFENFGYTRFVQSRPPRNRIRIVKTDGTTAIRTVVSSIELSATEERITVDTNWGIDAQIDEIERVDYITKVRMDTDDVRIDHKDTLGQARILMPVRVVVE